LKEITLLRHFRVKDSCEKKLFSSIEIDAWVDLYDTYDLDYHDISLSYHDRVYTSALSRAKRTAEYLGLEYEENALLNEVSAKAFIDTKWRFPKMLWLMVGRIYWSMGIVKRSESKKETLERARDVVDIMIGSKEETIMIVSHGFFMLVLSKELRLRGFEGEMDKHPKNGKPYLFKHAL